MEPLRHVTPLLGPSAVVIHTDKSCVIAAIKVEGADLLGAIVGPKPDAVLALGEHWAPGIPLRLTLDPDAVGEAVIVTVERTSPDAADAFMDAVHGVGGPRRKKADTEPSPSSDPGELIAAELATPSEPPSE